MVTKKKATAEKGSKKKAAGTPTAVQALGNAFTELLRDKRYSDVHKIDVSFQDDGDVEVKMHRHDRASLLTVWVDPKKRR